MRHRVVITAEAPLVLPSRRPDTQFSQSLDHVSGIALWGALGTHMQRTPRARFGPALPARADDRWVRVLPATAMSCKGFPGFLDTSSERPPHGVFDTLFDRACWKEQRPAAYTYDPHCPECLGRADVYSGYYAPLDADETRFARRSVAQRVLTRVAIDRRRGAAAESLLYSPLAIVEVTTVGEKDYEPTRFVGTAWDLQPDELAALTQVWAIGGRRSSGLGRVTITVKEEDGGTPAARLRAFNDAFAARWRLIAERCAPTRTPEWAPGPWQVFSVGLQGDALLYEDGWRPSAIFSAAQLAAQTRLAAELVWAQANTHVVGGWSARWNRHRSTVLAAMAGSVYLFRTQAGPEALADALEQIESEGIGLRRAEGFGAVRCCDPIHIQAIGGAL